MPDPRPLPPEGWRVYRVAPEPRSVTRFAPYLVAKHLTSVTVEYHPSDPDRNDLRLVPDDLLAHLRALARATEGET